MIFFCNRLSGCAKMYVRGLLIKLASRYSLSWRGKPAVLIKSRNCLIACPCQFVQFNDHVIEIAVQDILYIVKILIQAMVGYPILRKIVGSDFFRTVASADLRPPGFGTL